MLFPPPVPKVESRVLTETELAAGRRTGRGAGTGAGWDKVDDTVSLMNGVSSRMIWATRSTLLLGLGAGGGGGATTGLDLIFMKFSVTSRVSVYPLTSSAWYLTTIKLPLGSTKLYSPWTAAPSLVSVLAMYV